MSEREKMITAAGRRVGRVLQVRSRGAGRATASARARPKARGHGALGRRCSASAISAALVLLLATLSGVVGLPANAQEDREVRIKAAILFKLTRYVFWAETPAGASPAPLRLCVQGDGALLEALGAVEGREVDGRVLEVARTTSVDEAADCDLLYLGRSGGSLVEAIDELVKTSPALLISDAQGFAELGGGIELLRRDRRLGFRINLGAVRAQGLDISSSLLDLAEVINGDSGESP